MKEIVKRLMESKHLPDGVAMDRDSIRLSETVVVGGNWYWKSKGKCWTQPTDKSSPRQEIDEKEYREVCAKAKHGISDMPDKSEDDIGKPNKYSTGLKVGDRVKFNHGGSLSSETATIIGYDEEGFYKYQWDDGEVSSGSGDTHFKKVGSKKDPSNNKTSIKPYTPEERNDIHKKWSEYQRASGKPAPEYGPGAYTDKHYKNWEDILTREGWMDTPEDDEDTLIKNMSDEDLNAERDNIKSKLSAAEESGRQSAIERFSKDLDKYDQEIKFRSSKSNHKLGDEVIWHGQKYIIIDDENDDEIIMRPTDKFSGDEDFEGGGDSSDDVHINKYMLKKN